MKQVKKILAIMLTLVLSISMIPTINVSAAKKVKLNKTKATIYVGKTVTLKLKNNKAKVKWSSSNKKIATVSKKGKVKGKKAGKATIPEKVGKIGQNALGKCKKLKTITMPGNLKVMLDSNEDYSAAVLMSGSNVKTVKFNTAFEPAMASYCEAENLQVMAKDKKYKSINGMVYTKDGKKLVRVPMNRKTVNVNDGCEDICLSALLYEKKIPDDFPQTCGDFSEITIPKSVTKINDTEYTTSQVYYSWNGKKYTKTKVKGVYEYIPNNENYNLKITIKDGNENNISILNKYFKKANIIK